MPDRDWRTDDEHDMKVADLEGQIRLLRFGVHALRRAIHACNRNPIPNSRRVAWRDMCDKLLEEPTP